MLRTLMVAPHAGAWIETPCPRCHRPRGAVAPHAGAWIETFDETGIDGYSASRPTRARGLKQEYHARQRYDERRRAPRGRVD